MVWRLAGHQKNIEARRNDARMGDFPDETSEFWMSPGSMPKTEEIRDGLSFTVRGFAEKDGTFTNSDRW